MSQSTSECGGPRVCYQCRAMQPVIKEFLAFQPKEKEES